MKSLARSTRIEPAVSTCASIGGGQIAPSSLFGVNGHDLDLDARRGTVGRAPGAAV